MHILVFSPYYPPHRGGLESHSDEFNKHLSHLGVKITVLTPRLPKESPEKETLHQGVTVLRFPAVELIHNYPIPCFWQPAFWTLWKEISSQSPDIILSRTRFFFPSLMAGYLAWRKEVPWVHIEHGSDFVKFNSSYKNSLGRLYDCTLGRFVLKKADFLVANSLASKNFVRTLSDRTDCQVLYRGIEKEVIETALPQTSIREHYSDKILIGYIGRLIEGKGVKDLIEAFALVKETPSILIIIGDGPELKKLQDMTGKLGLENRIFFLGSQPLATAMGHLKTWDIFVNPSYTEGIPTAVIEAALVKKAIIATDVGGTKEIIEGTTDSILVPAHDPQGLALALRRFLTDTELRNTAGREAYKKVAARFIWAESIQIYHTLFKDILAGKK